MFAPTVQNIDISMRSYLFEQGNILMEYLFLLSSNLILPWSSVVQSVLDLVVMLSVAFESCNVFHIAHPWIMVQIGSHKGTIQFLFVFKQLFWQKDIIMQTCCSVGLQRLGPVTKA